MVWIIVLLIIILYYGFEKIGIEFNLIRENLIFGNFPTKCDKLNGVIKSECIFS